MNTQLRNPINPKMGYFYRIIQNLVNNTEKYVLAVAGYSYDKEKNAFSVGDKSIATGQDQFVFGRKNVEDTTKAEIVGGGQKGTLIPGQVIERQLDERTISGRKVYYLGKTISEATNTIYSIFQRPVDEGFDVFGLIDSAAEVENKVVGYVLVVSVFASNNNGISVRSSIDGVLSDYNQYTNPYITSSAFPFSYNNGEQLDFNDLNSIYAEIEEYMDKTTYIPHGVNLSYIQQTSNSSYWSAVVNDTDSTINIRTLDWEGNQWNAGDIICKDTDGSEISMRDLLSRIKALENPTPSNS